MSRMSGCLETELTIGSVHVTASPEDRPPFDVGAAVVEEDTYRLLGDYPVRGVREGYERLVREMVAQEPVPVGSVLVSKRRPLRILAVVHDLDQEPSCRADWVRLALDGVFREVERRAITALALPFLGSRHRALAPEQFLGLLWQSLEHMRLRYLKRVWLVLPEGVGGNLLARISH